MICAARPYLFDQEILDQYQDLISAAAKKAWSQHPMLHGFMCLDDVVQIANIVLWESLESHDHNKSPLDAWFSLRFSSALTKHYAAKNAVKRGGREKIVRLEEVDTDLWPKIEASSPADEAELRDDVERVHRAIALIEDPDDREFLRRRFGLSGRNPTTLAELGDKSGNRFRAIMAQLRKIMDGRT
jgi:RNA polymerase sigma factor (sigma-70 family)